MPALNRNTLPLTTPRPVKVLQFGEGNFLRAFVDWIIDILNEKTDFNGSVQVVQPIARGMGELINKQDGLYHVILNGIQSGKEISQTRLITCVNGVVNPYDDYDSFLKLGEVPDLRFIFSNTTEAGIAFDERDTSAERLPESFPGKITALLYHRFKFFNGNVDKGLVVIPCELIDKNGQKLKELVLHYIQLWELPDNFRTWIEKHNTFCNSLVDRIVPGFPKESIKEIHEQLGFDDQLVVTAEPFHLWVIEGSQDLASLFPVEKADLDVIFVQDQTPYRTRKVRILNGTHTLMVPVAYLAGLRTVRESIENEFVGPFLRETLDTEIIPTLDLPAEELKKFADAVIERFKNPFIKHELKAIALNSLSKFKVRVLPSIIEFYERKGALPEHMVFSFACLIRFYKGDWQGVSTPVDDTEEAVEFLHELWNSGDLTKLVTETLGNTRLWDRDLNHMAGLREKIVQHLESIEEHGVADSWKLNSLVGR